jgi:DNA-binding NtrC family response regulator
LIYPKDSLSQKRILIIQPISPVHLPLEGILVEQYRDCQVVVAPSIPALLNLLLLQPFNLVLIDQQEAGWSWLKLAQIVRGFWPDTSILLLAEDDAESFHKPEQSWAFDCFIQKPFTPEQLMETVQQLLEGTGQK